MLSFSHLLSYLLALVSTGQDSSQKTAANHDDSVLVGPPRFSIGVPWAKWIPRLSTATSCFQGCNFNPKVGACSCPRAQIQTTFPGTGDASSVASASAETITELSTHGDAFSASNPWLSAIPTACVSPCVWSVVGSRCDCDPTKAANGALPQRTHLIVLPDVTASAAAKHHVAGEL